MKHWFKKILTAKLARDTVWLTSSELVSRVIIFSVVAWLSRYLGSHTYGELAYGFAVANLVVLVADLGLSSYAVRELAKHPDSLRERLGTLLGVKAQLCMLGLAVMAITSILLHRISFSIAILGGIAILLMNLRMFIEACYRSQRKMHLEAISKMVQSVVLSGTLILLIQYQADLLTVTIGYVVATVLTTGFSLLLLRLYVSSFSIQLSIPTSKIILAAAWPFSLSLVFNTLFNYEDSAILGLFGKMQAVGWYTAAYKPIFFMTAIAGMVINAFFPIITKQFHENKMQVPAIVKKLFLVNMALGIPMALIGTMIAQPLLAWLYGPDYAPAILAFQILLWSTVGIYFWASFGNSLQACGQEKVYLKNFAFGAVLNTALNFLLIPWWSLYGAATATLLTQLFLCVMMYRDYRKFWKNV